MPLTKYRDLATRPVLIWAAVACAARLPVAMAALSFVFLVRVQPGGYALGAVSRARMWPVRWWEHLYWECDYDRSEHAHS